MIFYVSQRPELTAILVKLHLKSKCICAGYQVSIDNAPLPNIVNVTIWSFVVRVNRVQVSKIRLVRLFVLFVRDVTKVLLAPEVEQSCSSLEVCVLLIENEQNSSDFGVHPNDGVPVGINLMQQGVKQEHAIDLANLVRHRGVSEVSFDDFQSRMHLPLFLNCGRQIRVN